MIRRKYLNFLQTAPHVGSVRTVMAELQAALGRGRAVVFFDVSVGEEALGRIRFELFTDVAPRTAENFRQLCTGEHVQAGRAMGYKNSTFHRIIKGFMVQGGDFLAGDGTGSFSIYNSPTFADERFTESHSQYGMLSSANSGPNSNGCQFFITCGKLDWLDGKHVVFGRVLDEDSLRVVRRIEHVQVDAQTHRPSANKRVVITECGEL